MKMEIFFIWLCVNNAYTFWEAFVVNISYQFAVFASTQTLLHCHFLFNFHKIIQNWEAVLS